VPPDLGAVIADEGLDPRQRTHAGQRAGCISVIVSPPKCHDLVTAAGFTDISVTTTYDADGGLHSAII
jgi:hypothetical protein